jgi:hypothetical protein
VVAAHRAAHPIRPARLGTCGRHGSPLRRAGDGGGAV